VEKGVKNMLRVKVWLNVFGEIVEKEITMDESGKMIASEPEWGRLRMVMEGPIHIYSPEIDDYVKLDPKTNPFEFFKNLHQVYHGGLINVGEAEEI
jgi:hypothetical protein